MDAALLIQYLSVFAILVVLEGLLSADNALVLAVMVKPLPEQRRQKALFYGLVGAFVFRAIALLLISVLASLWYFQAAGAAYLLFIAIKNVANFNKKDDHTVESLATKPEERKVSKKEFWITVLKVEFADIAFAIDSILAAVALAMSLPPSGIGHVGGLDTAQFVVVFAGGFVGLIIMRFAATLFVKLLEKRPALEKTAFYIVGWVGVKLVMVTLSHEAIGVLPAGFTHSTVWQIFFFGVLFALAIVGWIRSNPNKHQSSV